METELADRLLEQPPTTVVDLIMVKEGLKRGSEVLREERDEELERIIASLGLTYRRVGDRYLVARSEADIGELGQDPVSRGRWFGIPECCIRNYVGQDKEELRKRLSFEELRMLRAGESVRDEFYLGSMGYIPCSTRCGPTLDRGLKARAALERLSPRLWQRFRDFHIRRRLVEYGGEIKFWREAGKRRIEPI